MNEKELILQIRDTKGINSLSSITLRSRLLFLIRFVDKSKVIPYSKNRTEDLLVARNEIVSSYYYFFPIFCPQDISKMAGSIYFKFSGVIENDRISRRFFHFFKIDFLSSVSCPATKSLSHRDLRNDKDLNIQTLRDDRPIVVDVFKHFCFVRRNFWSSPGALQIFLLLRI